VGCFIRSAYRPFRVNFSLFTSRPACLRQCSSVHGAFIGSVSVTVGAASVHGAFIGAPKSGASLSTFGVGSSGVGSGSGVVGSGGLASDSVGSGSIGSGGSSFIAFCTPCS
jgi:hypothetical protein